MDSYDDYDELDDDLAYFYVDDDYPLADDLAEHAIASPIPYDDDYDWDETSRYVDYWADLNYNGDGYDDHEISKKRGRAHISPAKSRKRKHSDVPMSPTKRLKSTKSVVVSSTTVDVPSLVFMTFDERALRFDTKGELKMGLGKSDGVMPDWRERYRGKNGFPQSGRIVKLQEVIDEDENADELHDAGTRFEASDDLAETEEAAQGVADLEIDSEALKRALKARLSAAGMKVNGMDEVTLLQMASSMMAGDEEGAEEIAGDLLGREEDDNEEGGFADWLSKQVNAVHSNRGANMHAVEGAGEHVSAAATEDANGVSRPKRGSLLRHELDQDDVPTPAEPLPLSGTASPFKRKAERIDDVLQESAPKSKRRAPSYAAATTASKARNIAPASRKGKENVK